MTMHCRWKLNFFFFILRLHYYLYFFLFFLHFILLSSCLSPHCLSISSFFLHTPIADLHEPNCHRPIAADLTHLGLSSLFSAFRVCVSGYACVLSLCFGLCLCFKFVFRAWVSIWLCWFFCFLFLFFFTGFDGHDGIVVVQWFSWVWWWLWLCVGSWMKYYFILVFILFYCVKS